MGWRATFVDAAGKATTTAFKRKADAKEWLDKVITRSAPAATPQAGRATIAMVYKARSAAPAHTSPKTAATRRSVRGSGSNRAGVTSGSSTSRRPRSAHGSPSRGWNCPPPHLDGIDGVSLKEDEALLHAVPDTG